MALHADKAFLSECDLGSELANLDFVGLLAFDKDYRYRVYSPVVERLTGIKAAEALGACAFDVFPFLKDTGADSYYHDVLADARGVKLGLPYYVERTGIEGLLDFTYRPLTTNDGADIIGGLFELRDMRTVFEEYWDDASVNPVDLPEAGQLLKNLGRAISARRKFLRLSQEELADRCGLHRTYITDIERGARNIAFRNVVNIARALDQPLWALTGMAQTVCAIRGAGVPEQRPHGRLDEI